MVRRMLKERKCSKDFWGDVVVCVVYLLYKSPTKKPLKDHKKKHEFWGKKKRVDHLRIFDN